MKTQRFNGKFAQSFEGYRREVDSHVQALTQLCLDDLDDVPLADWFDDGVSPKTAARRAIRNAGGRA